MTHKLLIVTGLSGAGLSSTLKALEDIQYEVLDNFPLTMIDPLMQQDNNNTPIAVGIDTRTRGFDPDELILTAKRHNAEILFLTAEDAALQSRYTETRRRHPLAKDRPVSAGIEKEKIWLEPVLQNADRVIDTSDLSIHDLRRMIKGGYSWDGESGLTVTLMSFGFKNGVPKEADIVMDVRFLKNPHWEKSLKDLTGHDDEVGAYVKGDDSFAPFIENFQNLLNVLLPRYCHEGKSYLTIAIGCTGGRHRSVFTVETLKKMLSDRTESIDVYHRDLDK